MDTRSSACNGELTSLMRKVLRKPQSRRREHSKRFMDLGSGMQIRSRSMRTRINSLRRDQTFVPSGHLDGRDLAAAAMRPSQRLNPGRDKHLLLLAIGQCLKAQYDTLAVRVPPRLAALVKQLEKQKRR
jgi:hypothetical protein